MKLTPILLAALAASAATAVASNRLAADESPAPVATPSEPLQWLAKAAPWLHVATPTPTPPNCDDCGMG